MDSEFSTYMENGYNFRFASFYGPATASAYKISNMWMFSNHKCYLAVGIKFDFISSQRNNYWNRRNCIGITVVANTNFMTELHARELTLYRNDTIKFKPLIYLRIVQIIWVHNLLKFVLNKKLHDTWTRLFQVWSHVIYKHTSLSLSLSLSLSIFFFF